jgi:hypothetical protein
MVVGGIALWMVVPEPGSGMLLGMAVVAWAMVGGRTRGRLGAGCADFL